MKECCFAAHSAEQNFPIAEPGTVPMTN